MNPQSESPSLDSDRQNYIFSINRNRGNATGATCFNPSLALKGTAEGTGFIPFVLVHTTHGYVSADILNRPQVPLPLLVLPPLLGNRVGACQFALVAVALCELCVKFYFSYWCKDVKMGLALILAFSFASDLIAIMLERVFFESFFYYYYKS